MALFVLGSEQLDKLDELLTAECNVRLFIIDPWIPR